MTDPTFNITKKQLFYSFLPSFFMPILLVIFSLISSNALSTADPCKRLKSKTGPIDDASFWAWNPWGNKELFYKERVLHRVDYEGFKSVALLVRGITKNLPLIGLGRSPGPFLAVNSFLNGSKTANLPLSGFRNRPCCAEGVRFPEELLSANTDNATRPLTDSEEATLFQHFENHLSNFIGKVDGPVIYITDISKTGASLFAATKYLNKYLALKGIKKEFIPIAVTESSRSNSVEKLARYYGLSNFKIAVSNTDFVKNTLKNSPWDNVAEFNSYEFHALQEFPHGWTVDKFFGDIIKFGQGEPNPSYQSLLTAIKANLIQDRSIPWSELAGTPPFELNGLGLKWSQQLRAYVDSEGNTVALSTGD